MQLPEPRLCPHEGEGAEQLGYLKRRQSAWYLLADISPITLKTSSNFLFKSRVLRKLRIEAVPSVLCGRPTTSLQGSSKQSLSSGGMLCYSGIPESCLFGCVGLQTFSMQAVWQLVTQWVNLETLFTPPSFHRFCLNLDYAQWCLTSSSVGLLSLAWPFQKILLPS